MSLPTDAKARKQIPIFSGLFMYFPHALAAVAQLSWVGDRQHNPGKPDGAPPHWAKDKSADELDAQARHMLDMAVDETHRDPDGALAAVKDAWRGLANVERMYDRGINVMWVDPAVKQERLVPFVAHPAVPDVSERELQIPVSDDGAYVVQVCKKGVDTPFGTVPFYGPFKTMDDAEQTAWQYAAEDATASVSVHALNYA